jgi:hypothetical protein
MAKVGELERKVRALESVLQTLVGNYEATCLTDVYLEHGRRLDKLEKRPTISLDMSDPATVAEIEQQRRRKRA